MWRARLQFIEDRVAKALRVAAQMRIPEPQCLDAARLQKFFPLRIMFPLVGKTMLAAVQFHVQRRLFAEEIQMVDADGMLAPELVADETPVAQPAPDKFFCPCFLFAKLAGAFDVGHDGNLGHDGTAEKFVLTTALTCFLSPGERILAITVPVIRWAVRQLQPRNLSRGRRTMPPLRVGEGRGEDGR